MDTLTDAVSRRRTFAIISHPDAGKTTLTEKLLLFGGAINLAGAVKARGEARRARSDWMKVEQERGISVASSVMTFEYEGCTFNLLDTPGHEDFSEDTYRTLTAVDSAVMVIDAAKGIETQTRKLFEVCRLRNVPIITFINKLDREGRDPFDLMSEIEQDLQLHVTPAAWPIGMGHNVLGCYDLLHERLILLAKGRNQVVTEGEVCEGLDDPKLDERLPATSVARLREEVEMPRGLCPAFVRLCSGRFERGMKLLHVRSGKILPIHNPMLFLARERELAEEAFAGDILGIPNHGNLRIGDALTEGEELRFTGIPSFAPELLKKVRPEDPMRAKHLGRALRQLAEEGAAQIFRPNLGNEWIVGVAGALQFDVLADRIRTEYNIPVHFEGTTLYTARWIEAPDHLALK